MIIPASFAAVVTLFHGVTSNSIEVGGEHVLVKVSDIRFDLIKIKAARVVATYVRASFYSPPHLAEDFKKQYTTEGPRPRPYDYWIDPLKTKKHFVKNLGWLVRAIGWKQVHKIFVSTYLTDPENVEPGSALLLVIFQDGINFYAHFASEHILRDWLPARRSLSFNTPVLWHRTETTVGKLRKDVRFHGEDEISTGGISTGDESNKVAHRR